MSPERSSRVSWIELASKFVAYSCCGSVPMSCSVRFRLRHEAFGSIVRGTSLRAALSVLAIVVLKVCSSFVNESSTPTNGVINSCATSKLGIPFVWRSARNDCGVSCSFRVLCSAFSTMSAVLDQLAVLHGQHGIVAYQVACLDFQQPQL
jgi:hypothetical protein